MTSCTPTRSILHLSISLVTKPSDPAQYKLLTFQEPNHMSIFLRHGRSKLSVEFRGPVWCFWTKRFYSVSLLASRQTPNHSWWAEHDCLFIIFTTNTAGVCVSYGLGVREYLQLLRRSFITKLKYFCLRTELCGLPLLTCLSTLWEPSSTMTTVLAKQCLIACWNKLDEPKIWSSCSATCTPEDSPARTQGEGD